MLDPETRAVLEAAAIAGEAFEPELVAAIAENAAPFDALDELMRSRKRHTEYVTVAEPTDPQDGPTPTAPVPPPSQAQQHLALRRARRSARWDEVRALRALGPGSAHRVVGIGVTNAGLTALLDDFEQGIVGHPLCLVAEEVPSLSEKFNGLERSGSFWKEVE